MDENPDRELLILILRRLKAAKMLTPADRAAIARAASSMQMYSHRAALQAIAEATPGDMADKRETPRGR